MLNDHWESSGATTQQVEVGSRPVAESQSMVALQRRPKSRAAEPTFRLPSLPPFPRLPVPFVYALVVLMVAAGAAVLFSTQTTRATFDQSKVTKAAVTGQAKLDFWIRDDVRSDALKKSIVLLGTQLELVDSKAGEAIDATSDTPSKWYRIRVIATGETGWVYSGWIERKQ